MLQEQSKYLLSPVSRVSKKSANCLLLAISPFCVFFAFDGTFNIQIILPLIVLGLIQNITNSKARLTSNHLILIFFAALCALSTAVAALFNPAIISTVSLFRILYVFVIVLYFIIMTDTEYSAHEISYILDAQIISSVMVSCGIIYNSCHGDFGKNSITSLFDVWIDPNLIAAFLCTAPLFLLLKLYYSAGRGYKALLSAALFIICLGIFLTGSRGAFLAVSSTLILEVIFLFFSDSNKKISRKILITTFLMLLLAAIAFLLLHILPEFIVNRFLKNSYVDSSNKTRLAIWKFALKGFSQKPMFGYGVGNYNYFLSNTIPGLAKSVVAHNTYLDILLDSGLIGFSLFLVFCFRIIGTYFHKKNIVFLPIILNVFITSFIVGAERSVYFWNSIIIFAIIGRFLRDNPGKNVQKKIFLENKEWKNGLTHQRHRAGLQRRALSASLSGKSAKPNLPES